MADTIGTLINGIESSKSDIADAIGNKGVTVPSGTKLAGMASLINQIPTMHGPAESTDGNLAAFDGEGGDTLKDSGIAMTNVATQSGNNTFSGSTTFTGSVTFDTSDNNVTFGGMAPTFGVGLNVGTSGSQAAPITFFDVDNGVIYKAQLALDGNHFVIQTVDNDGGTYGNISFPRPTTSNVTLATTADIPSVTNFVAGPGSSVNGNVVLFDGTTGKLIKDSNIAGASLALTTNPSDIAVEYSNGKTTIMNNGIKFTNTASTAVQNLVFAEPSTAHTITIPAADGTMALTSDLTSFVSGPNSVATDGNIAIYDGTTGKIIKDSTIKTSTGGSAISITLPLSSSYLYLGESTGSNYVCLTNTEGIGPNGGGTGFWHYITEKINNNTYHYYLPRKTGVLATLDDITLDLDLENGTGTGAIKQLSESATWNGINASRVSTQYTTAAVGKYAVQLGGKSHAEGERSLAIGTKTYAGKCALAAGDTTFTGDFGAAFGYQTIASGTYSFASGYQTNATGEYSHAEGQGTTASLAAAHAEGKNNTAGAYHSHAEGESNSITAGANGAHVEGKSNTIANSGQFAHVEGFTNSAEADYVHVEGSNNKASQTAAHAEGYYTIASGYYSHAEGEGDPSDTTTKNTASGRASHVEGYVTTASANYAHAEGHGTKAGGIGSHSEGSYAKTTSESAHAEGHNTFAGLYVNEQTTPSDGSGPSSGGGTPTPAPDTTVVKGGFGAHAEGIGTTAYGNGSHTAGFYTVTEGDGSYAGGNHTKAGYAYQTVVGQYNNNKSTTLFEVGNGVNGSPSNALEVYSDGHVEVGAESAIGADTFTITVTSSGSYPVDHDSYGVTDLPASKFDALYNYINNNGSKTVSESSSFSSTIISVSWTATTRTFDGVTYNAINCNAGGPGYYLYKYSSTEVRMYSAAVSLMTTLTVCRTDTDSGVMNILSPVQPMGVVTVNQFNQLKNELANLKKYEHNITITTNNPTGTPTFTITFKLINDSSNQLGGVTSNVAAALYKAGYVGYNSGIYRTCPASGLLATSTSIGNIVNLYASSTTNLYVGVVSLGFLSGSDFTIQSSVGSINYTNIDSSSVSIQDFVREI